MSSRVKVTPLSKEKDELMSLDEFGKATFGDHVDELKTKGVIFFETSKGTFKAELLNKYVVEIQFEVDAFSADEAEKKARSVMGGIHIKNIRVQQLTGD